MLQDSAHYCSCAVNARWTKLPVVREHETVYLLPGVPVSRGLHLRLTPADHHS